MRVEWLDKNYTPIDGIKLAAINNACKIIDDYFKHNPNSNIKVKHVAEKSGINKAEVKTIFFILLTYGYLVATFLPVHKLCNGVIGEHEDAVKRIEDKAIGGKYNCNNCKKHLDFNDIEIHLVFWKPGVTIKEMEAKN